MYPILDTRVKCKYLYAEGTEEESVWFNRSILKCKCINNGVNAFAK